MFCHFVRISFSSSFNSHWIHLFNVFYCEFGRTPNLMHFVYTQVIFKSSTWLRKQAGKWLLHKLFSTRVKKDSEHKRGNTSKSICLILESCRFLFLRLYSFNPLNFSFCVVERERNRDINWRGITLAECRKEGRTHTFTPSIPFRRFSIDENVKIRYVHAIFDHH